MGRWWPAKSLILVAVLAVATAGFVTLSGRQSALAQQGSLNELAQRAIGGPGGAATVTLLPGQSAADLPLSVPMPSGTNVVGTIERDLGQVKIWDLILDVPGAPLDAGGFYDSAMPAMGWQQPPTSGDQPVPQGVFCQSASGPWLSILAVPASDTSSDVRVHVASGDPGSCNGPPTQGQQGAPRP